MSWPIRPYEWTPHEFRQWEPEDPTLDFVSCKNKWKHPYQKKRKWGCDNSMYFKKNWDANLHETNVMTTKQIYALTRAPHGYLEVDSGTTDYSEKFNQSK